MRSLFLLLFLSAAFSSSVSAQAISSSDLDETWERLDLSETTTGILANRRAVFLDPTAFQGTASADTLNPLEWEVLYGQIRMSAANPAMLPDPATLAARTRSELAAGRLPIAVFYQPFDYVDAQDFQSGRLMVDASGAVEQVYRPTASSFQGNQVYTQPSPFDTGTVFAAGALYGPELGAAWLGAGVAGEPVTFIIPSDLVIVPQGVM